MYIINIIKYPIYLLIKLCGAKRACWLFVTLPTTGAYIWRRLYDISKPFLILDNVEMKRHICYSLTIFNYQIASTPLTKMYEWQKPQHQLTAHTPYCIRSRQTSIRAHVHTGNIHATSHAHIQRDGAEAQATPW